MITRTQHMDAYGEAYRAGGDSAASATHRAYYAQFVTDGIRNTLLRYIGRDNIVASRDEHFNDIPLRMWDALPQPGDVARLISAANAGGGVSLSDWVCTYKEAAQQIREAGFGVVS